MDLEPRDIFDTLKGSWEWHRTISNHGQMRGIARFHSILFRPYSLHYKEEGIFVKKNWQCHKVFKEYIYSLKKGQITVFFAEKPKRLFHTLVFSENKIPHATGTHLCVRDTYEALYTFPTPDEFTLTYHIKGPKKNYSIHTVFTRFC